MNKTLCKVHIYVKLVQDVNIRTKMLGLHNSGFNLSCQGIKMPCICQHV